MRGHELAGSMASWALDGCRNHAFIRHLLSHTCSQKRYHSVSAQPGIYGTGINVPASKRRSSERLCNWPRDVLNPLKAGIRSLMFKTTAQVPSEHVSYPAALGSSVFPGTSSVPSAILVCPHQACGQKRHKPQFCGKGGWAQMDPVVCPVQLWAEMWT